MAGGCGASSFFWTWEEGGKINRAYRTYRSYRAYKSYQIRRLFFKISERLFCAASSIQPHQMRLTPPANRCNLIARLVVDRLVPESADEQQVEWGAVSSSRVSFSGAYAEEADIRPISGSGISRNRQC